MTILPFARTTRPAVDESELAVQPTLLGVLTRRYGLLASEECVYATAEIDRSGDLAVADRIAFIAACRDHVSVLVAEVDGWFVAFVSDHELDAGDLACLRAGEGSPRILSLVTERGITPIIAPLVA